MHGVYCILICVYLIHSQMRRALSLRYFLCFFSPSIVSIVCIVIRLSEFRVLIKTNYALYIFNLRRICGGLKYATVLRMFGCPN